jgi:hypothetical protein
MLYDSSSPEVVQRQIDDLIAYKNVNDLPSLPPRDFMIQFDQGNEASTAKLLAITTTRNSMHRTMDGSFYAETDKWVFSILSYDTSSSTKILLHLSTSLQFVKWVFQFPTTLPCF